ncbi:MAG: hypothetical protein ACFE9Z_08145 [Promethearchaeota archaeon]
MLLFDIFNKELQSIMHKFIDIELHKAIINTIQGLDSAENFEEKLVNILKEFIFNKINKLNSKILTFYKNHIEKSKKSKDFKITNLDFDNLPLSSYQVKIINQRNKLVSIHDDLEKYIQGNFSNDDFKRHLDEFICFKN